MKTIAFLLVCQVIATPFFLKETTNELYKLLEPRSQNDIEVNVEKIRKQGLISLTDFSLSSLDTFKNEISAELKNAKDNDFEDMVYRMQLTYDEIIDISNLKPFFHKIKSYSLNPGIYEITDVNKTLQCFLPVNVKVTKTIDDIGIKSNLD